MLSSDISILLQLEHTSAFSFGTLHFLFNEEFSAPGKNIYFTVTCGVETNTLRIVCVQSAKLCVPLSSLDLTQLLWSTFDYYFSHYAMVLLQPNTSASKLCDSTGYTYDMNIYLGKDTQRAKQHLTVTHSTVTSLTKGLEGFGHKLYMDSFFSSPDLYDELAPAKNLF